VGSGVESQRSAEHESEEATLVTPRLRIASIADCLLPVTRDMLIRLFGQSRSTCDRSDIMNRALLVGLIVLAATQITWTQQPRTHDPAREFLLAHDLQPDGSVANRRNFTKYHQSNASAAGGDVGPGLRHKVTSCADGLAADKEGRVYNAGCNGIQVYSPQGKHLDTVPTARQVQSLAFAGPDKKTLYLVGRSAAWKIETLTQGYIGRAK
jgi:hypothetical protein